MTENYPLVEQPKKLKIKLYPHQLTAIHYLEEREKSQCIKFSDNTVINIRKHFGFNLNIHINI